MLQQTTVAAVAPRFVKFLTRFPTLPDLANADEDEVLALWQGLGYYRRARALLQTARRIVERFDGAFPSDPAALAGLPGMGEYTRNAVLSQAFGLRLPILEANSQRVLSRFLGRMEDPGTGPARRWLWEAAEALVPLRGAGEHNQALMELGALICTPSQPRCGECPIRTRCEAFRTGRQEEIPARTARLAPIPVREVAVVVHRQGRALIVRRPPEGRWGGLWEFPRGELAPEETAEAAARRIAALEIDPRPGVCAVVRHRVTRFAITLECVEADWRSGEHASHVYSDSRWVTLGELADYPSSTPQRRLTRIVFEHTPLFPGEPGASAPDRSQFNVPSRSSDT
jgi:A/G-specific adenine glycosylase